MCLRLLGILFGIKTIAKKPDSIAVLVGTAKSSEKATIATKPVKNVMRRIYMKRLCRLLS